jgi:hypothetical protein
LTNYPDAVARPAATRRDRARTGERSAACAGGRADRLSRYARRVGLLKAVGATPGAIVGIPLGVALFTTAVKGGALPSPLWLAATVIGTLVVMAALTIVPARISSMRSIVEALQSEAA